MKAWIAAILCTLAFQSGSVRADPPNAKVREVIAIMESQAPIAVIARREIGMTRITDNFSVTQYRAFTHAVARQYPIAAQMDGGAIPTIYGATVIMPGTCDGPYAHMIAIMLVHTRPGMRYEKISIGPAIHKDIVTTSHRVCFYAYNTAQSMLTLHYVYVTLVPDASGMFARSITIHRQG